MIKKYVQNFFNMYVSHFLATAEGKFSDISFNLVAASCLSRKFKNKIKVQKYLIKALYTFIFQNKSNEM